MHGSHAMSNPPLPSTLPSPRDLITSIFNSLPQTASPLESELPYHADGNPLKALGATARSLIVTLHILFPSHLLQALDLLDRGLVTKAIQVTASTTHPARSASRASPETSVWPFQAQFHIPVTDHADDDREEQHAGQGVNQGQKEDGNEVYLVRSAQSPHPCAGPSSSSRYGSTHGNTYVVHLGAWNCSCAAFAFSTFPASTTFCTFSPRFEDTAATEESYAQTVSEWEFGGWSFDGKEGHGEGVPCCKHLMACILAERWHDVFGRYVKLLKVGREEMAGLGVDGGV